MNSSTNLLTVAMAVAMPVLLLALFRWSPASSFTPSLPTHHPRMHRTLSLESSGYGSSSTSRSPVSIDVSDLGLTMEDLEKPIPSDLLGDFRVTTSGYQSTSRIESNNDEGCMWEESSDAIEAALSIEGLRGQPVAAMDVAFSRTTCTVTVFGFAVWSCVLRGEVVPESAAHKVEDGYDRTPLITVSVAKNKQSANDPRWDGFIETIGEDSIL